MRLHLSAQYQKSINIAVALIFLVPSIPVVVVRLAGRLGRPLDLVDWLLIVAEIGLFTCNLVLVLRGSLKRSVRFGVLYVITAIATGLKVDLPIYMPMMMKTFLTQNITHSRDLQDRQVAEFAYVDFYDDKLEHLAFTSRTIREDGNCAYVTSRYYGFLANPLLSDIRPWYDDDLKACGTFPPN